MAFDPNAATAAFIDSLGPAALQKAHDYTVGKEWMLFWDVVVAGVVTWLIVRWGILGWIEARMQRRSFALRAFFVTLVYFIVSAILTLPWTLYSDWWHQKQYGLTSQPLGDYLFQGTIGLVISAVVGGIFLMLVYLLIRRAGALWWLWAGGLTAVALAFMMLLAPILIEPLFNHYTPVPPGQVRDAVVEMAQRAGIPPNKVYMYNGSRQSNNFTANAGGVGSTARVAISDVAFKNASLAEVRAVTGHEIGHYVLKHSWWGILFYTVVATVMFWLATKLFPWFARRFGTDSTLGDPRGVPVLLFMGSLASFVLLPVTNTFSRTLENAADMYSLRTENLPDALSSSLVKTAAYRYPRPNRIEEIVFYDHPSVEERVHKAMEWKATHPANPLDPPVPGQ